MKIKLTDNSNMKKVYISNLNFFMPSTYLWRYARRITCDICPPDHKIGEGGYPHDGAYKGDGEVALAAGGPGVGQRQPHRHQKRSDQDVREPLAGRIRPSHAQRLRLILDYFRRLTYANTYTYILQNVKVKASAVL